jgi:hypothetical protein
MELVLGPSRAAPLAMLLALFYGSKLSSQTAFPSSLHLLAISSKVAPRSSFRSSLSHSKGLVRWSSLLVNHARVRGKRASCSAARGRLEEPSGSRAWLERLAGRSLSLPPGVLCAVSRLYRTVECPLTQFADPQLQHLVFSRQRVRLCLIVGRLIVTELELIEVRVGSRLGRDRR